MTERLKMRIMKMLFLIFVLCFGSISYAQTVASENSQVLFVIVQNQKVGFIDKSGRVVINPQFDFADKFSDGFARVFMSGKWGYINMKGEYLVRPQFEGASDFSEGLAAVQKNGKWGFINLTGKMVIDPKFETHALDNQNPLKFSEGLASVRTAGKCGYIDKSGKFIIKAQYYFAANFKDGLAQVVVGNGGPDSASAYINREGKYIWNPSN